jgi:hypothetical protein
MDTLSEFIYVLVGARDGQTQSARACLFFFLHSKPIPPSGCPRRSDTIRPCLPFFFSFTPNPSPPVPSPGGSFSPKFNTIRQSQRVNLGLPYILYYFQEFKQQSNSIVLGNYLYSSHIYSNHS